MKSTPKYNAGDTVVYKAGKRGYNYGFDNGMEYTVAKLIRPLKDKNGSDIGSEFGGWKVVLILDDGKPSGMSYPAGWFALTD